MFKIGDFSRLCQVTVKALRYYDELGLLKPSQVDDLTGYRYYSVDQLRRLNRILALKDLGFSLDQIGELLDADLAAAEIRGMLLMKHAEIQSRLNAEQERLTRVVARLRQIEEEDTVSSYDVVVKRVDPQLVASIREKSCDLGACFEELASYVTERGGEFSGPAAILYHDLEYCEHGGDVEAVSPIASRLPESGRIRVYELPGVDTMVCLVYQGPHNEAVTEAHQTLARWIESNGYRIAGANRIVFLQCDDSGGEDDKTVIEIQYPVEKL